IAAARALNISGVTGVGGNATTSKRAGRNIAARRVARPPGAVLERAASCWPFPGFSGRVVVRARGVVAPPARLLSDAAEPLEEVVARGADRVVVGGDDLERGDDAGALLRREQEPDARCPRGHPHVRWCRRWWRRGPRGAMRGTGEDGRPFGLVCRLLGDAVAGVEGGRAGVVGGGPGGDRRHPPGLLPEEAGSRG